MTEAEIEHALDAAINEALDQGPGFAQEGVVLREAAERLGLRDLEQQQRLLTHWHQRFITGDLSWGYNIDNPNAPFFHRRSALNRAS